jgi:hypothetical protein
LISAFMVDLTFALNAVRKGCQSPLNLSQNYSKTNAVREKKDKQDQEDQANAAAWIIAPTAAVAPSRQGADQEQNEYDQKDSAHFDLTPRKWLPDNAGES